MYIIFTQLSTYTQTRTYFSGKTLSTPLIKTSACLSDRKQLNARAPREENFDCVCGICFNYKMCDHNNEICHNYGLDLTSLDLSRATKSVNQIKFDLTPGSDRRCLA